MATNQPKSTTAPKKLHLIANSRSGKGAGETLHEIAKEICTELGVEFVQYDTSAEGALEAQAKKAVDAAENDGGVVVAAGGDGTIRGVAQIARGRNVKFAVVPVGTFNFFARNHQIPEDFADAFRIAIGGELKPVRLGEINGEIFLINASLGLYAKAIREREQEVVAGHGEFRFAGYLTVSATDEQALNGAVAGIRNGLAQAALEPQVLYFQQAEALMMNALPTGGGLK